MAKKTGEKYQAIIDAAVRVIAKHGYHQAQVSRIAKEAKVADGTIYLYFKNKEDVLVSLFAEKMGHFIDIVRNKINEHARVEEQLKVLIETHFQLLSEDPDLAVVTQLELRQSDPELRRQINDVLKHYLTLIEQIVQTGKEQGVFQQEMDLIFARHMIFGTLDESVTNWVLKDRKYALLTLVNPLHKLFLSGLRG